MYRGLTIAQYKRIHLVNPSRSEAFHLTDGTAVEILFYLTEQQRHYRVVEDSELTPVVFENNKVVGWGWTYL